MEGVMRAARMHGFGEPFRVEEVPIPDLASGEALVRVLRASLNRGDWHMREADLKAGPGEASEQVPDLPMTIGHNGLGEVAEVGPGVHDLQAGDRVIVKTRLTCGSCKYCRSDREHLCVHHRVMGFLTLGKMRSGKAQVDLFRRYNDGLWAEYCRVPRLNLAKLQRDDDVDKFVAVIEISHGYRGLKRARLTPGETVIVNGATGVTGTGAVMAALAMGAGQVIAVARRPGRLAALQEIDPMRISTVATSTQSIRERVTDLTKGNGAQVLIDLTPGGVETVIECLQSLEPGGRATLIGGNTEMLQLPYRYIMLWAIEVGGSLGQFHVDVAELVELVHRGLIDPSRLRPRFYKLEQVNQAVDSFATRSEEEGPVWPMMRAD